MISAAGQQLITSIVGIIASGAIGFLIAKVETLNKYSKARLIIDKASAREHIKTAYKKYVIGGKKMSISTYDDLLEEYEAYKLLGGNGTGERYMAEIKKLKPFLITD